MRDGLTAVSNRRAFDEALRDAAARASADGSRLGILIVDIDRFKQYNDSFGHQAGDEALRMVASTCSACVRDGDMFARYGGEEFAAIIPGATHAELLEIGNRMCAALNEIAIELADGSSLTISVGGASGVPIAGEYGQDVLSAADAALYDAKRSGRNRVSLGNIRAVS
jgi:diguanylate cyclase (GGDEF)-like protein